MLLAPAAAMAQLPAGNWQLQFADEFKGTSLDTIKWNYNYPWGNGPLNNEDEVYLAKNTTVSNGHLNLTAIRDTSQGKNFTSGAINSNGRENFSYGYIEASLKMPQTLGTWPAFWMLQNGWPPEIDIQETPFPTYNDMYGYYATYHYTSNGNPASYGSGYHYVATDVTAAFHNYGLQWTPNSLTFYFDGTPTYTVTDANAIAQSANMYMLLNLAVGGWPGEPPSWASFPTSYQADWVRVWQLAPAQTTLHWKVAGNGSWDSGGSWSEGASPQLWDQTAWFGVVNSPTAQVTWAGSRTVGQIVFQSATNYTLGSNDGNEGLLLASPSGRAYIDGYYQSGQGTGTINARLELYNNVSIQNWLNNPIVVNGNIIGTGELSIEDGKTTLNGQASYTGDTVVTNGGNLTVNGAINSTSNLFVQQGMATIAASGTVTSSSYTSIGRASGDNGTLNLQGTLTVNGDLNVGDVSATGVMNISAGATVNAMTFYIGKFGSSNGAVVQSGGSVNTLLGGGDWRIGGGGSASDAAAVGTYKLQGGSINVANNFQVGAYGKGTLTQTGGAAVVSGYLSIGRFAGSTGIYDMSTGNGVLTANSQGSLIVAENGTGTLLVGGTSIVNAQQLSIGHNGGVGAVIQTGGTVNAPSGVVFGLFAASGSGTYTLSGGTLNALSIAEGAGSGTFNFNGGTLKPTADNAAFLQGLSTVRIQSGGATIDTNGHSITIAEGLLDSGSGRLTKSGLGTLTLTGANTFAGGTTVQVNSGTLRFNVNSGAATVGTGVSATIGAGASLELAGSVSALSTGGNRVSVLNIGFSPAGLLVSGTHQQVGGIDGPGATQINVGSDLTANHIIQSALVIGGTAGSAGLVTIDASDSAGNPLAQSGGFALANSLAPSGPFGADGISSADLSSGGGGAADLASMSPANSALGGNPSSVPEPSALLLVLLAITGLAGQGIASRRRARRNDD